MGFRRQVSRQVEKVAGPDRTRALRQLERRGRRSVIRALDVEGRVADRKGSAQSAGRSLTRAQQIDEIGRRTPEGLGAGTHPPAGLAWVSMDPPADYSRSDMTRHSMLSGMHERLQPRTYFEVGVNRGESLTLSRTRTIAVDPSYQIVKPVNCDVATFLETSDDFFALADGFAHFGDVPVDLAFIDGMHLSEYVVRDFINIEKHMSPGGVVILDDMLPRSSLEAYRIRRTGPSWTGDIFKVHQVLRDHRPDLTLMPLNTEPTGSYLVVGLDPQSRVLDEVYPSLVPMLTAHDPQVVSTEWLERHGAYDPAQVVSSDVWAEVVQLRNADSPRSAYAPLWERLAALPTLGQPVR